MPSHVVTRERIDFAKLAQVHGEDPVEELLVDLSDQSLLRGRDGRFVGDEASLWRRTSDRGTMDPADSRSILDLQRPGGGKSSLDGQMILAAARRKPEQHAPNELPQCRLARLVRPVEHAQAIGSHWQRQVAPYAMAIDLNLSQFHEDNSSCPANQCIARRRAS